MDTTGRPSLLREATVDATATEANDVQFVQIRKQKAATDCREVMQKRQITVAVVTTTQYPRLCVNC
jgi:hypothetical protein